MYYILIGMSLLLGFITKIKHGKKVYCFIMFLALFIVSGWRDYVGYDHSLYVQEFYNSYLQRLEDFVRAGHEKGYLLLNETLSNLTIDYQWIFIAVAFIVAAGVMWFIYKYSKNVWLSTFCFITFGCFYFSMDFMRQIVAAIIMLYAYKRLDENDYLYYVLLVLFASTFHKSALLMLPLLLILKVPLNKITCSIYIIVSGIGIVFSESIIQLVLNKGYYSAYVLDNIHMTTGISIVYGIVTTLLFLLAFLFRKDLIKMQSLNRILIPVAFLNAVFTLIGAKHSVISRFSILLEIPIAIILLVDLVVVLMKKSKQVNIKMAILAGFIMLMLGYNIYLETQNYNGVFPYKMVERNYI